MSRALMQRLGLDKIGEVLAEEVRRAEVEVLQKERTLLAKMIEQLDTRIDGLRGKRRGRPPKAVAMVRPKAAIAAPHLMPRKRRRRKARITPKPGETLKDFVLKALAKAGGPVNVSTLVDLVLEAGYETNAKRTTLVTSTYPVLTDKKLFRKMGKGVFGLATAPTRPARQRGPRKRKKANATKRPAKVIARERGETLQVFILRACRQAQRPMKAREIAKRVKTLGYQTTSSPESLLFSVGHVLDDEQLFRNVGRGLYELALPASKPRVGGPRKRAKAKKATPGAATEPNPAASEEPAPTPAEVKAE